MVGNRPSGRSETIGARKASDTDKWVEEDVGEAIRRKVGSIRVAGEQDRISSGMSEVAWDLGCKKMCVVDRPNDLGVGAASLSI